MPRFALQMSDINFSLVLCFHYSITKIFIETNFYVLCDKADFKLSVMCGITEL